MIHCVIDLIIGAGYVQGKCEAGRFPLQINESDETLGLADTTNCGNRGAPVLQPLYAEITYWVCLSSTSYERICVVCPF